MRILTFTGKGVVVGAGGIGLTTAPSDLAEFLRSTADWIDGGGSVELILWSVVIFFGLWMMSDFWTLVRGHRRERKEAPRSSVDYAKATLIATRYIDPDDALPVGVRITVRSQILAKFEEVEGAKVGDEYNVDLLHRWFQKNAARALVKHQSEIR